MKKHRTEKEFVKHLCRIIPGAKATPTSGGIPGWGGDVDVYIPRENPMKLAVEVKKELPIRRAVQQIWDKITGEAHERMMIPVLLDGNVAVLPVDDFIDLISQLYDFYEEDNG